jgi:Kef-type K+ transport system membrane component KefB/glycine cleavage system regulatory protein
MDAGSTLFHVLVVLVASRVAAEVAERIRQPAVVIEILAGLLIGPSVFALVDSGEVLTFLGELGAILLLFEVGMQMDLKDLSRVGSGALRVAAIGVIVPMALAYPVLSALGLERMPALFIAAGITATSVGITARVFGDLKMLASPEASTVLGAAVADDVAGLLILTVVTGIAATGKIAILSVAPIVGAGLAFVIVATALCAWLAPKLFARISESAGTEGTLMALGLSFALALALLASAARLAPIVGAFIAGLAISGGHVRDDLRRRLVPLGHFFIPIFFLLIGVDADVASFLQPEVLGVAGVVAAIALLGKLAAGLGMRRGAGDRLLVGIGMIPRGEVGLIFAGIGLARGVLDARWYAVLVSVVLFSTIVPPPWIRHRVLRVRRKAVSSASIAVERPGGWLRITTDEVELVAEPPIVLLPRIGLEAAIACANARPGPRLLQRLSNADPELVEWDGSLREKLYELLQSGNERSWRFLEVTGLGRALLPTLEESLERRRRDPFELDPAGVLRWETLENLDALIREGTDPAVKAWNRLNIKHLVLLVAVARDAFEGHRDPAKATRQFAESLRLAPEEQDLVTFLVTERHLMPAAAARLAIRTEDSILELAVHLENRERADALYVLAAAEDAMETWERERLDELFNLVLEALRYPDLISPTAESLVHKRQGEAIRALSYMPETLIRRRIEAAPRRYLLAQSGDVIARHLKMTQTLPGPLEVRLEAEPVNLPGNWLVHVATRDRKGLLASIAGALAAHRVSVLEAFVSTWRTGVAIDVFRVVAPVGIDWESVRGTIAGSLVAGAPNGGPTDPIEGLLQIDNQASPWHTIVEVQAADREGLLYRMASALSHAGLTIHMATVTTVGETAVDIFYVTGRDGAKLDQQGERDLRAAFAGKRPVRWRLPWAQRKKVDA